FHRRGDHPHLHSFPTRRSSDLTSCPSAVTSSAKMSAGAKPSSVARPSASVTVARRSSSLSGGLGALRLSAARRTRAPLQGLPSRSEEHTSELQSQSNLVCRLLL